MRWSLGSSKCLQKTIELLIILGTFYLLSSFNVRIKWKAYEDSLTRWSYCYFKHEQECFIVLVFAFTMPVYVMWPKGKYAYFKINFNGEFTYKIVCSKSDRFLRLYVDFAFCFFSLTKKNSHGNIYFSKSEKLFYRTVHNKNFLYICFNVTFS